MITAEQARKKGEKIKNKQKWKINQIIKDFIRWGESSVTYKSYENAYDYILDHKDYYENLGYKVIKEHFGKIDQVTISWEKEDET